MQTQSIFETLQSLYGPIAVAVSLALLTYIMFRYLQRSRIDSHISKKDLELSRKELSELRRQIERLNIQRNDDPINEKFELHIQELIERIQGIKFDQGTLSKEDKQKIFELFEKKIQKNLSTEILNLFESKYSSNLLDKITNQDLRTDFEKLNERLLSEISKMSLRANLNLAIGSATTILAVLTLYFTVVTQDLNFENNVDLMSYIIPRISLVIFIEIFAFFFLRLYKTNLNDIKYYQNELTTSEFKITSLKSAFSVRNTSNVLEQIIVELSKVERNKVLKKGETTIEIESLKSENKSGVDFLKNLEKLIDKMKK